MRRLICVVESDGAIRDGLETFLVSYQYRVHSFSCAEQFLQDPDFARADVVLCAEALSDLSGAEVFQVLADRRRYPLLGFALLCDEVRPRRADAATLPGAVRLKKPLVSAHVASYLQRLNAHGDHAGPSPHELERNAV